MWTVNFQMFKMDLEKTEELEIKIANICWIIEKAREFQKNIYFCFIIVNETEIDVFLEFSCFLDDSMDVGNLISGSSAFSKSILNIWKFTVHVLLKPGLENFEHYFASCEMSAIVQ